MTSLAQGRPRISTYHAVEFSKTTPRGLPTKKGLRAWRPLAEVIPPYQALSKGSPVVSRVDFRAQPFPSSRRMIAAIMSRQAARKPKNCRFPACSRAPSRALSRHVQVVTGSPFSLTPPCAITPRLARRRTSKSSTRRAGRWTGSPAGRSASDVLGSPPFAHDAGEVRLGARGGLLPVRAPDDEARERELRPHRDRGPRSSSDSMTSR